MTMQVPAHPAAWDRLYVKGRDFDQGGIPTPKEELRKMPGLFKLNDVLDRIPFAANRIKFWYSDPTGPFRRYFPKLLLGQRRSLVYVDLAGLSDELQQRFEGCGRR
jgi:hypothetical protein